VDTVIGDEQVIGIAGPVAEDHAHLLGVLLDIGHRRPHPDRHVVARRA